MVYKMHEIKEALQVLKEINKAAEEIAEIDACIRFLQENPSSILVNPTLNFPSETFVKFFQKEDFKGFFQDSLIKFLLYKRYNIVQEYAEKVEFPEPPKKTSLGEKQELPK